MSEKILDQLLDVDATNSSDIIPCSEAIENENNLEEEESIKKKSNDIESDNTEKKSAFSKLSDAIEPPKLFISTSLSLILAFYKLIQDVICAKRYTETEQETYFLISLFCLIGPSCMFGIYMTAKYYKKNIETESESSTVTAVIIFLKNTIFFLPLKFSSFVIILKFLINYNKTSCCKRLDDESKENIKELEGDKRIISFFQRFFASLPQIVLQFYIVLLSSDKYIDYTIVYPQLILSGLSINSLCATVDREDDGTMSIILSRIGWLSTIFSRCLTLALLTSAVGYWMVLPCAAHIILITVYLTLLTEQTYLKSSNANCDKDTREKLKASSFFVLLTTFGVQSLVFWPMMFDLNDKSRPAKFFGLLLAENFATIVAVFIWNFDFDLLESLQILKIPSLLSMVLIMSFTLLGMLFIYLYYKWKPRRTAHWKLHRDHMEGKKNTEPVTYGVYYEFCSVAFTIPAHLSPNELEDLKINP